MRDKKEVENWILNNCLDEDGDVDLSFLDFSDYVVYISNLEAKKIHNNNQKAHAIFNSVQNANEIDNSYQRANLIDSSGQRLNKTCNYCKQALPDKNDK